MSSTAEPGQSAFSVQRGAGALGLISAITAYSIVFGISFVALALRLKNHKHASAAAA